MGREEIRAELRGHEGLAAPRREIENQEAAERGTAIREKALEILRQEYGRAAPPDTTLPASGTNYSVPGTSIRAPSSPATEGQPISNLADPIPARMLNEFVYCPRLFYFEFVEGVFVDNADALRGGSLHRRVDSGAGDLPPARKQADPKDKSEQAGPAPQASPASGEQEGQPEVIHSRSVQMGSVRLGVSAKMDLVEVRGSGEDLFSALEVCPVDYKAGAPKEGTDANELWDSDKMQLGLQVLILRDNGYACREGVIFYRATKQRVRLSVTPELEAWIIEQGAMARKTAAGEIPPPLVNSPKCPRCSLVTVCLPDETRVLAAPAAEIAELKIAGKPERAAPRRLIAARDDAQALYLN